MKKYIHVTSEDRQFLAKALQRKHRFDDLEGILVGDGYPPWGKRAPLRVVGTVIGGGSR